MLALVGPETLPLLLALLAAFTCVYQHPLAVGVFSELGARVGDTGTRLEGRYSPDPWDLR